MPRPCYCDRAYLPKYSAEQCFPCWLFRYNAHWQKVWADPEGFYAEPYDPISSDAVASRMRSNACVHRGEELRRVRCGCGDPPVIFRCAAPANERHECSLVKICGKPATVEPNVPACKNCPWRELPESVKPRDNPGVPALEHIAEPGPITPKTFHLLDDSILPQSERNFNGGMIRFDGRLLFVYRQNWGNGKVFIAELNEDYTPIYSRQIPIKRWSQKNARGDEDPRPFIHDGKLWIVSDGFAGANAESSVNMHVAQITPEGSIVESRWLKYDRRRKWEKNWTPFSHAGKLHAVYQVEPSHVALQIDGKNATDLAETPFAGVPGMGLLRGGACPVLHNGEYYSFVHGVYRANNPHENGSVRQFYTAGLYTFSSESPFKPLRYLPFPLLSGIGVPEANANARVVFPCGAFFENGQWVVSGGWHDRRLFVAKYDGRDIEDALRQI